MVVFRYEWKRSQKYVYIWAAALAACIFFMTPVYYGMIGTAEALPASFGEGGFLETLGVSLALLAEPLGMYEYLTGFLMNAGGIFGMHLGICLYGKECTEHTAEYLFTKPCRRGTIFGAKALCMLCGVSAVGAFYMLASLLALLLFRPGFPAWEFFLVALSFLLLTLFFGELGMLIGARWPHNRSPLLTAGLTVFSAYGVTAFARTADIRLLSFLSPFSFFGPAEIHAQGFYEWDYLLWYLFLAAAFLVMAYHVLMKRDVMCAG